MEKIIKKSQFVVIPSDTDPNEQKKARDNNEPIPAVAKILETA